jgi:cytochrome c
VGLTFVNFSTFLTLDAIDGGNVPAGTAETLFRVWNGSWSVWHLYSTPFRLTGQDGTCYLEYYSVDRLGSTEEIRNNTIVLDNTAPELTIQPASGELTVDSTFNLTATDSGSGVRLIEYSIDGGGWVEYAAEFGLPEGLHTIEYQATDNVGNVAESIMQVTIKPKSDLGALAVSLWPVYVLIVVIVVALLMMLKRMKGKKEDEAPPALTGEKDDERK